MFARVCVLWLTLLILSISMPAPGPSTTGACTTEWGRTPSSRAQRYAHCSLPIVEQYASDDEKCSAVSDTHLNYFCRRTSLCTPERTCDLNACRGSQYARSNGKNRAPAIVSTTQHVYNGIIALLDVTVVPRRPTPRARQLCGAIVVAYFFWIHTCRYFNGHFPYPFLNKLSNGAYACSVAIIIALFFTIFQIGCVLSTFVGGSGSGVVRTRRRPSAGETAKTK